MERLTLSLSLSPVSDEQTCARFTVPDIRTALIVADINRDSGKAQLYDGERLLAEVEPQGRSHAPFWHVY